MDDEYETEDIPVGDYGGSDIDIDSDDGGMSLNDQEEARGDPGSGGTVPIPRTEQVQLIHMRRYLDHLADRVTQKDYLVQKTREELQRCREQIEKQESDRDVTFRQIEESEAQQNVAAVSRLRAAHEKLCEELRSEQELEEQLIEELQKAEYDLSQAHVEQGRHLLAEDRLAGREQQWGEQRTEQAIHRTHKEDRAVQQAARRRQQQERQRSAAMEEQERRRQHTMLEAKRSHERHNKFLKETMSKLQQREKQEHEREQAHYEQRMTTMLALKGDIAANRENLRALQARDKAVATKEKEAENNKRSAILDRGGNHAEEMYKQKKLSDFEKEKHNKELRDQAADEATEAFEAKREAHFSRQRELQVKMADKILQEDERIERRKQQQPYLWSDPKAHKAKMVKPHKKPKLQAFELYMQATEGSLPQVDNTPQRSAEPRVFVDSDDEDGVNQEDLRSVHALTVHSDSEGEPEDDLAKPEFEGLWDKHKPYKVPKDMTGQPSLPGGTKMEKKEEEVLLPWEKKFDPNEERVHRIRQSYEYQQKEMMQRVLDKHRQGIVIKQVAGGREFKGQAFYSKPDLIHFKDFEVGKQYKRKVTLTNVSYTVNYCKLIGLTEHLKDFITVHFDPPGQMSAGLTCEMLVTFKPMINEDLMGQVDFLAQTGPFAIPIVCSTKKCDLTVDQTSVDFGTAVIGETLKRHITLTNNGALGTTFDFTKITGLKQRTCTTAETSLGRLTTADTIRGVSPDSVDMADKSKGHKDKQKGREEKRTSDKGEPEEADTEDPENSEDRDAEDAPPQDEAAGDAAETDPLGDGLGSGDEGDADSVIPMSEMEDMNLDGLCLGTFSSGTIGPFSSVKLEIIWQPTLPGRVDTEFMFSFSDPLSENISVQALAHAVDVPVWVERQNVDLKICMFDRLYQDTIIVNNRATTALRLSFNVCKELRNHIELLPRTGYIQAQSQFSAQLKFLPRKSLMEEGSKYFDKETGVLQAPMVITVADQTRVVPFTVHAVVTVSDMEFSTTNIDFGKCTIYEAVRYTVQLTNHSILPQKYGFVGLPEYVDVQPNDGFGTLLPLEQIELDIIFKPPKARDYSFELTCKSLINREFKIKCKGVGVHPPLNLSHQVIHFAATALNDVSLATLKVVNSHTSSNEFTHPVPRIGKGEIAPVGPTSFEFVVPEDAPLTLSPSVGTVMPGKECKVEVRFTPRLSEAAVRKEAVRMMTKMAEVRAAEEHKAQLKKEKELAEQASKKAAGGKQKGKASPKGRGKPGDAGAGLVVKGPTPIQVPEEGDVDTTSDEYAAACASLIRQFKGRFDTFVIPCYVASGQCANPGSLPYSVDNTLYVEMHCPAKKPELVVISDNGRTTTDFGDVSIGQSVIRSITIQNISDKHVDMTSSILDTAGPFQMLNALRLLPPDTAHTLLVCFAPHKGEIFQETLSVISPTSTLHITLRGKGVSPVISLSIAGGVFDMGAIIAGEYREEIFTISNTSALSVQYAIKLDSQSQLRYARAQGLPDFITNNQGTSKNKLLVGTQNNNGQNVFDCVPAEGVILPGTTMDITVTFAPDHSSDHFSDFAHIELFGQEEMESFKLIGEAKARIMYLTGGDELVPSVESLAVMPAEDTEDGDSSHKETPMLVSLHSVARGDEFTIATKDIYVGCVRTMAVSQKKNGEWYFDNIQPLVNMGFNIDPIKGMLEAGTKKPITITWTPPPGFDPNKPVSTSINCTVKGDVAEVYKIMIRAFVVSE